MHICRCECRRGIRRFEIVVQPFPGPGGGRWQVSTGGGVASRWNADGRELYFIAPDGSLMAAAVSASATTFEAASPAKLFATRIVGGGNLPGNAPQYAVSRDGRFLVNELLEEASAPITLILNVAP